MTNAAYDQASYRIRFDDGTEVTANWQVPANIDVKVSSGRTQIRIRMLIQETGGKSQDFTPEWRYSYNGGTYTLINTTSSYIQTVASGTVGDGTATTQQLGAGDFDGGSFDSNGTIALEAFNKSDEKEYEGCFEIITADIKPGDTIAVRMYYSGGTQLEAYSNTPTLTIRQKGYMALTGQGVA